MKNENTSNLTNGRNGWFKSSYSNALGSCVEVNLDGDGILIRDSKDKRADPPVIAADSAGWTAFLTVVAAHTTGS